VPAPQIDRAVGRVIFGADAAGYEAGRLSYPDALYEMLETQCGLRAGAAVFEIGPGTGQATRELLKRGASVTATEPDGVLAMALSELPKAAGQLYIRNEPFEDAALPASSFDLGVAATSFGWVDPAVALPKILRTLRPGGWWAMWWNVFRDVNGDPIFDAMARGARRPSAFTGNTHYALDSERWIAALAGAGFQDATYQAIERTIELSPKALRALYATFSPLRELSEAERNARLDGAERLANAEASGGVLKRTYATPLYIARKPLS
jgi:SAM-dependent methyltransferase